MRFEIKNRWTGNVQYTAEIDCDENALRSVKVGLAVKWGLANDAVLRDADLRDADLSGAVLSGADLRDADLSGADLRDAVLRDAVLSGAVLRDADLRYAVLSGAVLRDADLRYADLRGADLRYADLRGAVLSGADLRDAVLRDAVLSDAVLSGQTTIKKLPVSDPRPYSWIARAEGGTWIVYAGCRRFTVPEARDHWLSQAYDGPEDVKSTVALALDWIEAQAVPTPDQIAA